MPSRRNTMGMIGASAFLTAVPGPVSWAWAQRDDSSVTFVKSTTAKLVAIANSGSATPEKRRQLEAIVDASVDVDGIGRFCMGRFWQSATLDQQKQYLAAFRYLLVTKIADHLGEYQGVRITVGQAREGTDTEIVVTTLERSGTPSARIDWVVSTTDHGSPKIVDLLLEGASLRQTQTSDFRSYLALHNYNVQNLVDGIRRLVSASR